MARIFISYKRSDRKRVGKLVSLLHEHYGNTAVWWDQHFVGGDLWWNEILKQIADCDVFIYLMTSDSLLSPYCQAELEEARRLHKRILPVKFKRGTNVPQMPAVLHYVDLDGGINHRSIAPLLRSINEQMNQTQRHLPPLMNTPVSRPDVSPRERQNVIADYAREIIIGIMVTIVGGVILAWILQSDRFTPSSNDGNIGGIVEPTIPTETPTSTATNTPDPIQLALDGVSSNDEWTPYNREFDGIEMALVPAGCFTMGNDPDGQYYDNGWVTGIPDAGEQCFDAPFWIDRYEVTNAQFAQFLNANGNQSADGNEYLDSDDDDRRIHNVEGTWIADEGYEDHPAIEISWFGARDYCSWRDGVLPTEAQWEYVARGVDRLYCL